MSKTYKGWELMKAIADGEIKKGCELKDTDSEDTIWKFNGESFEEPGIFGVCRYLTNNYQDKTFSTTEFELIEDEINIDSIEELNDICYDVNIMSDDDLEFYHNKTRTTINEILQAVKQIDKRVKKLERD